MVLKGSVIIKTFDFHYCKYGGEIFGELEMLADVEIDEINFETDAVIVTLSESEFNTYFYDKIYSKY